MSSDMVTSPPAAAKLSRLVTNRLFLTHVASIAPPKPNRNVTTGEMACSTTNLSTAIYESRDLVT